MADAYDPLEQALRDALVPDLQVLKEEVVRLKRIEVEITRLEEKIEARVDALKAEIARVEEKADAKFYGLRNELLTEIRRLEECLSSLRRELELALEIRERLAALEAKLGITRP